MAIEFNITDNKQVGFAAAKKSIGFSSAASAGKGGVYDHTKLKNRDADDQHPMSAITGLQSALYVIDGGKVDKVTGKGLSTNDYNAAAKAKVDAIPSNPKYTDTIYDDTALKGRVATIEGKESGWDGKYSKPSGGIPNTDLESAVQTSLGKADTALQSVPSTYALKTDLPTKTSDLTNDSGYLTLATLPIFNGGVS